MSKKNKSNQQQNQEDQTQISDQISEELSEQQVEEENQAQQEEQPSAKEQNTVPFDISQLSQEQIQQLKEVMNQTPNRSKTKQENPKVLLPVINGKRVINFSKAYLRNIYDTESASYKDRQHIDVQLEGEKEMTTMLYRDFMQSPREEAEILRVEHEPDGGVIGETWSKEKQAPVEMRVDGKKEFFTLKTQDGKELKLSSRLVNA